MTALIAEAKKEGQLNVITLPSDWAKDAPVISPQVTGRSLLPKITSSWLFTPRFPQVAIHDKWRCESSDR